MTIYDAQTTTIHGNPINALSQTYPELMLPDEPIPSPQPQQECPTHHNYHHSEETQRGPHANAFTTTNTILETNVLLTQINLLSTTLQTITQVTKHPPAVDKILTTTDMADTCKTIPHTSLPLFHLPSALLATIPTICIMLMIMTTNETKTTMRIGIIMLTIKTITTKAQPMNNVITSQHMNQQIMPMNNLLTRTTNTMTMMNSPQ